VYFINLAITIPAIKEVYSTANQYSIIELVWADACENRYCGRSFIPHR
jgi:hypothetical protein